MANFQDPSRSNPRAPSTTFAPFACRVQSRGAFPFYALLRGLAYSAARARDDDNLVFNSIHEVLLSIIAAEVCLPSSF
jgi:hypothetical protein